MPGDDVGEGGVQGVPVEVAGEPEGGGDVVRGRVLGLQAVQEPPAALPVGGGDAFGAAADGDGPGVVGAVGVRRGEVTGQPGRGGGVEQLPDGHVRPEGGADPGGQAGGQQGVPAEGEEVAVGTDLGQPEDACEQFAEQLFVRGAGGAGGGVVGVFGRGQRLPVELAVRGERQGVQQHDRGRDHVLREGVRQLFAQRVGVGAAGRNGVSDQSQVTGPVLAGDHGGLGDLGQPGQSALDLAEFDAVAADLDLAVGPADEDEGAVVPPADEVAGAVHAGARVAVEARVGVGDEAFGGEAGAFPVAAGQAGSGDVQLAGDAGRHGAQGAVEHVGPGVGEGAADGHGTVLDAGARFQPVVEAVDGGLGGSVGVVDDRVGVAAAPAVEDGAVQGLAADDEGVAGRRGVRQGVQEFQVAGGDLHERRLSAGVRGVLVQFGDADGAAADQGRVQRRDGQVEGDRRVQEGGPGGGRVLLPGALQVGGQRTVFDHHALGAARRARGVDDVRRVPRQRPLCGLVGGVPRAGGRIGVVDEEAPRGGYGDPVGQSALGHDEGGVAVPQHVLDAVRRIGGVDRHVGGTGPHHGEQGDHQVGGAGQHHRDERLGAGPRPAQPPGEAFRAGVQLGVRHHGAVDVQGRTGGGAAHLLGEEGGQGGVGHVTGGVVPLDEGAVRVLGVQDVGPSDGQGGALQHFGEEAEEPVPVGEQRGVLVQAGVRVEVDVDAAGAVGGPADVHGEVPDASGGQLAGGDRAAGEVDGQVLGDEVDDRSGERVRRGTAEVPVEVLAAVALVPDGVAHLRVGLCDQVPEGRGGVHVQPQRHLVGEHAGGGEGGTAGAGGDGEAEDDVAHRGEPVEVGGDGGHQDDGPAGAGRAGRRGEGGDLRLGQPGPGAQFAVGGLRGTGREAGRLRRVGEGGAPVRGVPGVGRGAEVGGVVRQEVVQGAERGGGCVGVLGVRRVQLGDAAAVEDLPPAVEGDVVVPEDEEVAVRGEGQQRVPVQGVLGGVDGCGQIVPHPGEGGGVRVLFAAEVDMARGRRLGNGPQPQALVVLGEADAQRRGLLDGADDGSIEQDRVHRRVDVEEHAAVVQRAAGLQLLRDPDAQLCR